MTSLYDDFSDSVATNQKWTKVGETSITPEHKLLLKNDSSANSNPRIRSTEFVGDFDGMTNISFKWTPGIRIADIYAETYAALVYEGLTRSVMFQVPQRVPIIIFGQVSDTTSRTIITMGVLGFSTVSATVSYAANSEYDVSWFIDWNLKKMSLVIDEVNVLTNVSFEHTRTQGMMLELGNPGVGGSEELFDDVSFNSFYKEAVNGKAHRLDGSPADHVVIRNFITHENVAAIVPDSSGRWGYTLPSGKYDITYFSEGCAPICHGPYIINRTLTPPAYSSLGGERVFLCRMNGTPNWYSDYYGHSSSLVGSAYQNKVIFKSEGSSLRTDRSDEGFLITEPMALNQEDFVFEGYVLFPDESIAIGYRRPFLECNYDSIADGARGFVVSISKSNLGILSIELMSSSSAITRIEFSSEAINQWIYFAVQRVDGVMRLFIKTEIGDGSWSESISGNNASQNWIKPLPTRIGGGYTYSTETDTTVVTYIDSIRITKGSHYGTDENPWPIIDGNDLIMFN